MIRFACSTCGRKIEAEDQYVGRKGKCPGCGSAFVVPDAVDTAAPAPVATSAIANTRAAVPPATTVHPQVGPTSPQAERQQPTPIPVPTPTPRRAIRWVATAVGVLFAAGGAAVWLVSRPPQASPASATKPTASRAELTTAAASADSVPPVPLPVQEDGRFVPGRIIPSARIVKTYYVSPGDVIAEDGEQVFVSRTLDGKISMVLADRPAADEPPELGSRPSVESELAPRDWQQMAAVLSPDGKRLAYVRPLGRFRAAVVLDGEEGPELGTADALTFSPDGKRFAYVAIQHEAFGFAAVVDGKQGPTYGRIFDARYTRNRNEPAKYPVRFSPDSAHVAYGARTGRDDGKALLVVDGQAQTTDATEISDLTWAPDSRRIACIMTMPAGGRAGSHQAVCLDGKVEKLYGAILPGSLRFSGDGTRLVYVAGTTPQGPFFVVDTRPRARPTTSFFRIPCNSTRRAKSNLTPELARNRPLAFRRRTPRCPFIWASPYM